MDNVATMIKNWDKNFEALVKEDKEAGEKGMLVGRYLKEQIADGYAFYKIIKESKTKVTIRVVKGIGDDWTIPYWGEQTTIDKKYAIQKIFARVGLEHLFGRK